MRYTLFNASRTKILMAVKRKKNLKRQSKMKTNKIKPSITKTTKIMTMTPNNVSI